MLLFSSQYTAASLEAFILIFSLTANGSLSRFTCITKHMQFTGMLQLSNASAELGSPCNSRTSVQFVQHGNLALTLIISETFQLNCVYLWFRPGKNGKKPGPHNKINCSNMICLVDSNADFTIFVSILDGNLVYHRPVFGNDSSNDATYENNTKLVSQYWLTAAIYSS